MTHKLYYKIVSSEPNAGNEKYSIYVRDSRIRVKYQCGKRASSPHGPLFIYDSLEHAQADAAMSEYDAELWTCRAGGVRPTKRIIFISFWLFELEQVAQFWRGEWFNANLITVAPAGTLLADWVELVERVER
jgi:hypothetical protein